MKQIFRTWISIALLLSSFQAWSAEWCTISSFLVTENSGSVSLTGSLSGASGTAYKEWLLIDRNESADIGKQRLAMALAASLTGRSLLVYVGDPYTCLTVPHWTKDVIVHLRVL